MKHSLRAIGLLQAIGLAAYVATFAFLAVHAQSWFSVNGFPPHPVVGILLFLLAFIISALISGAIIFAYPTLLFFDGKRLAAFHILLWSVLWLLVIFGLVAAVGIAVAVNRFL